MSDEILNKEIANKAKVSDEIDVDLLKNVSGGNNAKEKNIVVIKSPKKVKGPKKGILESGSSFEDEALS